MGRRFLGYKPNDGPCSPSAARSTPHLIALQGMAAGGPVVSVQAVTCRSALP